MNRIAQIENIDSLTDEEIITKILNGHSNLFEILIKRYNQQVFRIARSYISNTEEVKDVMQTAYLKAFENLNQFRAEAKFSTWLTRIVINESLKVLNQEKRNAELYSVTNDADRDLTRKIANMSTPESKTISSDMNTFLERAIDRLPPKYRSVLIMREVEQMSTKETADCLGISPVNVKVRLFRAKSLLREELEKAVGYGSLYSFMGQECDDMTQRVMRKIREKAS